MPEPSLPQRKQGLTAIDGAMALIVLLLVTQIWLLSATLEAVLAGHREAAIAGAAISGVLFAGCAALYAFVDRLDSTARSGRALEATAKTTPPEKA